MAGVGDESKRRRVDDPERHGRYRIPRIFTLFPTLSHSPALFYTSALFDTLPLYPLYDTLTQFDALFCATTLLFSTVFHTTPLHTILVRNLPEMLKFGWLIFGTFPVGWLCSAVRSLPYIRL